MSDECYGLKIKIHNSQLEVLQICMFSLEVRVSFNKGCSCLVIYTTLPILANVSPIYLPSHGSNSRSQISRYKCELDQYESF